MRGREGAIREGDWKGKMWGLRRKQGTGRGKKEGGREGHAEE